MKNDYKTYEVESNVESLESFNFGIGNSNKLLELAFKELYNFPIRTCVQEYVSNAIDSHNKAGVCISKIKITAPTEDHLFFTVQDQGTGIAKKGMNYLFNAGASGSDMDDDSIGGFGFGSKMGVGVAESFYITSVKDGIKLFCEAKRDPSGKEYAKFDIISEEKTKEKNGIKIEIPCQIDEISDYEEGIERVCRHLKIKPTVTNLELNYPEILHENDNFIFYKNVKHYRNKNIFITLGGIEYPLSHLNNENKIKEVFPDIDLGLKFDIADFRPQPNREFLRNEKVVREKILNKAKQARKELEEILKKELDSLDFVGIVQNLKTNPIIDKYNKTINDFNFYINKHGIYKIEKNGQDYFDFSSFFNLNGVISQSKKYVGANNLYFSQLYINREEKTSILKKKIKSHSRYSEYFTSGYGYNRKTHSKDLILASTDNSLNSKELKDFFGHCLTNTSDIVYEETNSKKERISGEFTYTLSNKYCSNLEKVQKEYMFIPYSEYIKLKRNSNAYRLDNNIKDFAHEKNITFYVISQATQKQFEKKGCKELKIETIRKHYEKLGQEKEHAIRDAFNCYLSEEFYGTFREIQNKFPKLVPNSLNYKVVSNTIKSEFFNYSKYEEIKNSIDKELEEFYNRNKLFCHMVWRSSDILDFHKNDKLIKELLKSVK